MPSFGLVGHYLLQTLFSHYPLPRLLFYHVHLFFATAGPVSRGHYREYELVLPNSVKKVVFIGDYILITIDDLDGSILLFKRQEKSWTFVDRLESFEHQSLINRRLNHVYYEGNAITFVFNNRVRKYDLNSGKMIVNQQLRDAKSKEYSGIDIMMRLVGR